MTENWMDLVNTIQMAMCWEQSPRKHKHRWWNVTHDQIIERNMVGIPLISGTILERN